MKKVLVTGIGMLTAVGNGRDASWKALKSGTSGIGRITKFDPSRCTSQVAGEVKGFEEYALSNGYIDKKAMRHMGLFSQYAVAVAREAWNDSGLVAGELKPADAALIVDAVNGRAALSAVLLRFWWKKTLAGEEET